MVLLDVTTRHVLDQMVFDMVPHATRSLLTLTIQPYMASARTLSSQGAVLRSPDDRVLFTEQAVTGGVATVEEGVSPSRHSLPVDPQGDVGLHELFPLDDGVLTSPILRR